MLHAAPTDPRYAIQRLGPGDAERLLAADPQLFDFAVSPQWTTEFLGDSRHHIVVATFDGRVIGSVTGVHYVHPDQAPTLFVVELAVAAEHQQQGVAKTMLHALLAHGRALGCTNAWVGTESDNHAARHVYETTGCTLDSDSFVPYSFDLT